MVKLVWEDERELFVIVPTEATKSLTNRHTSLTEYYFSEAHLQLSIKRTRI
jgi:hypothetical protein